MAVTILDKGWALTPWGTIATRSSSWVIHLRFYCDSVGLPPVHEMIDNRCVCVSVRGSSHIKSNEPCQDAGRLKYTPYGVLIVAVADGAGSAGYSDVGARIAVDIALDKLDEYFANEWPDADEVLENIFLEVVRIVRQQVIDEAQRLGAEKEDLASTLILCVASKTKIAVFHIGDGAVVVRTTDGVLQTLSTPTHGRFINETDFLTQANFGECGQFISCTCNLSDIAIITDGLELVSIDSKTYAPFERFFNPLMNFFREVESRDSAHEQLEVFLQSSRIYERTDDDLTLALASWILPSDALDAA